MKKVKFIQTCEIWFISKLSSRVRFPDKNVGNTATVWYISTVIERMFKLTEILTKFLYNKE
jgi:hypothetical protein